MKSPVKSVMLLVITPATFGLVALPSILARLTPEGVELLDLLSVGAQLLNDLGVVLGLLGGLDLDLFAVLVVVGKVVAGVLQRVERPLCSRRKDKGRDRKRARVKLHRGRAICAP